MAPSARLAATAGLILAGVAPAGAQPETPAILEVMLGRTTVLAREVDGAVERLALYLDPEGSVLFGDGEYNAWYPLDSSGDEVWLDGYDLSLSADLAEDGTLSFVDVENDAAYPVVALFTGNLIETLQAPPAEVDTLSDAALVAAVLADAPLDYAAFGAAYPPTVTCHFPCLRGMTAEQRTGFLEYLRTLQ